MTDERFNQIVDEELENIKKVLCKKKGEYNLDTDRMSAFKEAAEYLRKSPEDILMGYRCKHEMSLVDMINSGKQFPKELWLEKITDNINYLLLLLGLLEDDNKFIDEQDKNITKSSKRTILNESGR